MASSSRNLSFRLITEQSAMFSIAGDWSRLLAKSSDPRPMLDPRWMLGWWRQYGAGVELAVGVLFDGERPVGLAPLCIRNYHYGPGLVFRRLQFMGVDVDEWDGICSMYMGFISLPGYEADVIEDFIGRITAGEFGMWHEVMLGPMRSEFPLSAQAKSLFEKSGLRCEQKRRTVNYYVKLRSTWDEYLQSLPSGQRTRIHDALIDFERWASQNGGWKLEYATAGEALEKGFSTLLGLQHDRSSPRFIAFQHDYIASSADSQNIEIACLKVGNVPVAVVYGIRDGKEILVYHYGGAVQKPNQTNIGLVMNALLIQKAIAHGDEGVDFLSGGFGFDEDLATDQRPIVSLRIARPTWREAVRVGGIRARDAVRSAVRTLYGRPVDRPAWTSPQR